MRTALILLFLFSFSLASRSQIVTHLSLKQLQDIYQQSNDTTYVVNFWATWCGPCVMEMPALLKFYDTHKNSTVKLMLVSLDQPKFEKQLKNFISKNKIEAPVYLLEAGKNFDWLPQVDPRWEGSIPATLVINVNRKIKRFYETPLEPGQLEYLLKKDGLD
jgi:thiol-disulfide isomerase/thioredoxin